jgi:Fe-S cluster biosynthesis and repair protein YggX
MMAEWVNRRLRCVAVVAWAAWLGVSVIGTYLMAVNEHRMDVMEAELHHLQAEAKRVREVQRNGE